MAPRIRSPTPSDADEVDQLASDSAPEEAGGPAPRLQQASSSSSSSRKPTTAAASTSTATSNPLAGLKIKFKLGASSAGPQVGTSTAASSPASSTSGRKSSRTTTKSAKAKAATAPKQKLAKGNKGKGKKRADSDDESDLSLELTDDDELQYRTAIPPPRAAAPSTGRRSGGARQAGSIATQSPSVLSSDLDELASDDLLDDEDDNQDDDDESNAGQGEFDDGYDSQASDVSGSTMTTGTGDLYGGRKTARQRAREMGGDDALELMSLPNHVSKLPPPARTEAELAELKAEKSKKRKSQADKKLEDEKTETINRLLNKQVGRASSSSSTSPTPKGSRSAGGDAAASGSKRSRSKLNKSITAGHADGEDGDVIEEIGAMGKRRRVEVKPSVARWICSIRAEQAAPPVGAEGEQAAPTENALANEPRFRCTYSLPESRAPEFAAFAAESLKPVVPATHGPDAGAAPARRKRDPPKTRMFSAEEKEANRRRNEDGWRKVMLGAA